LRAGVLLALAAWTAAQSAPRRPFEAYPWRGEPAPEGADAVLSAVGGALALPGEPLEPLLARELDLVLFNAPGRDELHLERDRPGYRERFQRWYDTRSDDLLVRDPCLSDPRTLARLEERMGATLSAAGVARLRGISLGDEVGWTAHAAPEDTCLCEACQRSWLRFLSAEPDVAPKERERFGRMAEFSTDATRLALGDGGTDALRPWLLRRRFCEAQLRAALDQLAARAHRAAPGVPIGLLGIQPQSPFGTPRQELLLGELDFAEAYRELDARTLLFTLRRPELRSLLTVFPNPERPDLTTWAIWEHWLAGGDGVVVWSDRELAQSPELLATVQHALRDVRAAQVAAPGFAPAPAGAAVVHDFDSIAASWLRDALLDGPTWPRRLATHQAATGTWETSMSAWLALLADCGVQPGSLPLEQVDAQTAQRFQLLVLSEVCVLDEDDLERLARYLAAGGSLLVSGDLGWVDSRGSEPEREPFERLKALAPERVHAIEDRVAHYTLERARRTPRGKDWRATIRAALGAAGVETAPWRVAGALDELPWLCAWSGSKDGTRTCATLPNWDAIEGQGEIVELALEIEAVPGFELEWVRPAVDEESGARLLAPGEAAVFRLLPRAAR
jgi:hypothetical protein